MTYEKLKRALFQLTNDQLNRPVRVMGDEKGFLIDKLFIEDTKWITTEGGDWEDAVTMEDYEKFSPEQKKEYGRIKILSKIGTPYLIIKE